jgi:hypothetical protein
MAGKYDKNRVEWVDNGSPKLLALLEADAQKAIAWITEQPLRTLTGQQCREWCAAHGWSAGYGQRVIERAGQALKVQTEAEAATVRARLISLVERLIPECVEYRTGTGPSSPGLGSEGTVFLKDPKTGEHLKQIDHAAVKGYVQLLAQLAGVDAEAAKPQGPTTFVMFAPVPASNADEWVKTVHGQVQPERLT